MNWALFVIIILFVLIVICVVIKLVVRRRLKDIDGLGGVYAEDQMGRERNVIGRFGDDR